MNGTIEKIHAKINQTRLNFFCTETPRSRKWLSKIVELIMLFKPK